MRVAIAAALGILAVAPSPAAAKDDPRWGHIEDLYRPEVVSRFAFVNHAVTARDVPYWDGRHVGLL